MPTGFQGLNSNQRYDCGCFGFVCGFSEGDLMANCKSFKPRADKSSRVLILGSMPGVKSLEKQEYYAHPQNRFWKVMGELCSEPSLADFPYEKRVETLLENGFALWDVISKCRREGSLDSDIKDEKPNDIRGLLKKYPNIGTILLNGNKAFSSFKKHFPDLILEYNCIKCPSTSPANARYRLEDLVKEWETGL